LASQLLLIVIHSRVIKGLISIGQSFDSVNNFSDDCGPKFRVLVPLIQYAQKPLNTSLNWRKKIQPSFRYLGIELWWRGFQLFKETVPKRAGNGLPCPSPQPLARSYS